MCIKEKEKIKIRSSVKSAISSMSDELKAFESSAIWQVLERNELFINSNLILCYWSMDDEVDTQIFLNKWFGIKQFLLPSINGNTLDLKYYFGTENMYDGKQFNIPEPVGSVFSDYDSIDMALIPGRAFDANGSRLGRGKGFYDRLLNDIHCPKIGVCYKCQFFNSIPTEEHDIRMDTVLHV